MKKQYTGIPQGWNTEFCFLDDAGRPYKVAGKLGKPWLFCWDTDHWKALYEISTDVMLSYQRNTMPAEKAKEYEERHEEWMAN